MRGDASLKGKMIDRNWILKRKRKRVSSILDPNGKAGTSLPLNSPRSTPSVKPKKEDDISGSEIGQKIKGHDGYYYECVECDLGGDLLCCDSCPRTYHRECLSPPIKHNPPGKWQCPSCQRKDFTETSTNLEEHLVIVRSKSSSKKLKSLFKQSENKASHSGRNSLQEKNGLDNRGKTTFPPQSPNMEKNSDFTQVDTSDRTKSSSLPDGGSRNSLSTPADNNDKKPRSPSRTETSSHKDVSSFVKILSPDLGGSSHGERSYLALIRA